MADRTWPESPDGSFWVEWSEERDSGSLYGFGVSQLGNRYGFELLSPGDWALSYEASTNA